LHNRFATLFRHSALDAEFSNFNWFWIPATPDWTRGRRNDKRNVAMELFKSLES
jgi:hypothetical protein